MFTGNDTDGHNGSLKSNICPSGYSAPKITDFDTLIQAYGGTKITELSNNERLGYKLDGDDTLHQIFNFKNTSETIAFWSSTERDNTYAYYFSVPAYGAQSYSSHAKITDYYYAACLKASS